MKFKKIGIKLNKYSEKRTVALGAISEKINQISEFFEKISEFENLILNNIYDEYLNLIRTRDNRTKIEKIGGPSLYINDYFLKSVNALELIMQETIQEWDYLNEDLTVEDIKFKVNKLKEIKAFLCKNWENDPFIMGVCELLNAFAHFKVYELVILETSLDKIELLLSFRNEIIEVTSSENVSEAIKKQNLSIDDL